jgi:hypothetical protein
LHRNRTLIFALPSLLATPDCKPLLQCPPTFVPASRPDAESRVRPSLPVAAVVAVTAAVSWEQLTGVDLAVHVILVRKCQHVVGIADVLVCS